MATWNKEMTKIAVIGAGQMGSGIAQVFATSNYTVKIMDISVQSFEKSQQNIKKSLEKLYGKSLINTPPEQILKNISYHENIHNLDDCEVFIESAFEDFETKSNILYQLAEILTPQSYVATNTSSYSVTSLSKLFPYPERFIGFHFMNPVPMIELVEVIRGHYTNDETFNFFFDLAKSIGKTPIAVRNAPGFVLNRILLPMINEAIYVLYSGISTPEQIDTAMTLGSKHPIGPLALADLIGLDTVLAILKTLQKELGENKYAPCPLLEEYVANKRLGRKTKKGFYEYE